MDVATSSKLTYDDFMRWPVDDGRRHELIDGAHYVTPSPFTSHQRVVGNLYYLMRLHLEGHPDGKVFVAPFDVVLSMFDIVEPDLLFISNRNMRILTRKHVRGVPDLVVEVSSPATKRRDEGVKLGLYDRMGVEEYWIVEPEAERIHVHGRRNRSMTRTAVHSGASCLTSRVLPGIRLDLARVFAG
jgi:Uma2 family endonuclease